MQNDVLIQLETPDQGAAIAAVIDSAFAGKPYSEGDEAHLVDLLRDAGALTLSLVAMLDGKVIGHAAFSPAECEAAESTWFALGPLAVLPEYQRQGVGSRLLSEGLERLGAAGAGGCILVGDVRYYGRHGFTLAPDCCPLDQPPEHFMIRALGGSKPSGRFRFHSAFGVGS